jgi:hypothetical protein
MNELSSYYCFRACTIDSLVTKLKIKVEKFTKFVGKQKDSTQEVHELC